MCKINVITKEGDSVSSDRIIEISKLKDFIISDAPYYLSKDIRDFAIRYSFKYIDSPDVFDAEFESPAFEIEYGKITSRLYSLTYRFGDIQSKRITPKDWHDVIRNIKERSLEIQNKEILLKYITLIKEIEKVLNPATE